MKHIKLSDPVITKDEKNAVMKVLNSGYLASGKDVSEFETNFAKYIGTKHAIAVSNGTTALHAALISKGIASGDKVLTTPFTFIASSNVILHTNAKPVFCDIDEKTYDLDPNKVETILKKQKNIKAILLVHLYGQVCDMDAFKFLAKKYKVSLIEDCAQSIGSQYKNKHTGSIGDLGCFSFYATKNMMTGEGGMITTNNTSLNNKLRQIINHGRLDRFKHNVLGYNFRMTNIAASIGNVQLKKLEEFTTKRIKNAELYNKLFAENKNIITPYVPSNTKHSFHQYAILVNPKRRNSIIEHLKKHNVDSAAIYALTIPAQPLYKKMGYKELSIAKKVSNSVICIPVHPKLTKSDIIQVAKLIKQV
ncbi:DegT/DnrJ/EryC1/StrS family aminotransferase [bacterium]